MARKDFKPFYFDYKGTIFHRENNWTYTYDEGLEMSSIKSTSVLLIDRR